jgi:hypothetical protein
MAFRSLLTLSFVSVSLTAAAGVPLVELKAGDETYRGRVVAKDAQVALLMDRDGILREVPLAKVTGFGVAEKTFMPYEAAELRDRLKRIVGRGAEVAATPHYVVAGRPAAAKAVAEALEDVYEGYRWYGSTHRLPVTDPEFPLVALVMPDRESFDAYCAAEGMPPSGSLQGYYRPTTNRFVCYEGGGPVAGPDLGGLKDVLVHESLHQLAFNTGLHARGGEVPKWVAEGFATALEPEAARRPLGSGGRPLDRANPERLQTFLATLGRRHRLTPADVVASDDPFGAAVLEAYAMSWALTFYLMETKPAAYGRYLRNLSDRSPLTAYPPEERVADFATAFGDDWKQLDAELTRFMKRVAAGERR